MTGGVRGAAAVRQGELWECGQVGTLHLPEVTAGQAKVLRSVSQVPDVKTSAGDPERWLIYV